MSESTGTTRFAGAIPERSPTGETLADELHSSQRGLRDLTSLMALPAVWAGHEPKDIAESLADILLSALGLDFVYVCVKGSSAEADLETVRTEGQPDVAGQAQAVGKALAPWLQAADCSSPLSIANPVGSEQIQLAVIPIGREGEYGVIAAGAQRTDFPTEIDRLLLNVGANQAAVWFREARFLETLREADQLKDNLLAREQAARAEAAEWKNRYDTAMQATGQLLYDRNAQMLLAAIVESSGDAILSQTLDGVILSWNTGAERLYGYAAAEVIGQPVSLLAPPEQLAELPYMLKRLQRGERVEYAETVQRKKDGTLVTVSLTMSPVTNADGQIIGASAIAHDITARKQAEEALTQQANQLQRANDELQQFAYIVSHDLNEPLRTVANFASLLAKRYEGKLDAAAEEYIDFVVDGTQRIQRMIQDLLLYTRAGGPVSERTPVDCEAVLMQVMSDLQVAITEQRATITYDPLPIVLGEAARLKQVFQNLIGNALKFRGKEPPHIHVSAQRLDGGWQFAVRDNGIGMESHQFGRLFQVFQRLHASSEYPGSGMGLAICKKIVERHGGRMWVESQPGQGTTFFFIISDVVSDVRELSLSLD